MKQPTRRVLGIDPGSHHLGVGCVDKIGNTLRLVFVDTLHAPAKLPLFDRLEIIQKKLIQVVDSLRPEEVAVEDTFFGKNARSAFTLGVARGVAIGVCLNRGIKMNEYAPTQVKSVVTGSGRADKDQVAKMVRLILGAQIDAGPDATDALAIAICHANTLKFLAAIS